MLSKEIFTKGLEEIETAFDNFIMTPQKAKVWYKYVNYLPEKEWQKKIRNCIRGCRKTPALADIIDFKGYYIDGKLEGDLEAIRQEREWQKKKEEPISKRSEETKIKVHEILAKINPKYGDKLKELEGGKDATKKI